MGISLGLGHLLPPSAKKLKASDLCIRSVIYKENVELIKTFGSILWKIRSSS